MDDVKFKLSPEIFFKEIKSIIIDHPDVSYIDAIVEYSERYNIEIEVLAEIVKKIPAMKANIHDEAQSLNLVEKTAKLPV